MQSLPAIIAGYNTNTSKMQLQDVAILDSYIKNQGFKSTNRDCKKANKQDIRYCLIDSNGQDNIQLTL